MRCPFDFLQSQFNFTNYAVLSALYLATFFFFFLFTASNCLNFHLYCSCAVRSFSTFGTLNIGLYWWLFVEPLNIVERTIKKLKKKKKIANLWIWLICDQCRMAKIFVLCTIFWSSQNHVKNCPPVRRRPLEPGSGMGRNCAEYKIILKFIHNYYIIVS